MEPLSYQPFLEPLMAYAAAPDRKEDLLRAKAQYFELTGEVNEEDKSFEMRMTSFLDYFLFDRPSPLSGKTPAQELFEDKETKDGVSAALAYRGFTETIHGLFEVRKLSSGSIRVRELFGAKDYEVTERRQMAGLAKGDLLEARLIPFEGHLLFSNAFCYHPKDVGRLIKKEVQRRKKKEPNRPPEDLTWECAKMALKAERYRQIAIEKIYDFANRKI